MREGSGGKTTVDHGWDMPEGVKEGLEQMLQEEKDSDENENARNGVEAEGPFVSKRLGISNSGYLPCLASIRDTGKQS